MLLSWKLYPTPLFQDFATKSQQCSGTLLLMYHSSVSGNQQKPDYQLGFIPTLGLRHDILSLCNVFLDMDLAHAGLVGDEGPILDLPMIHLERNGKQRRSLSSVVFNTAPLNYATSQPATAEGRGNLSVPPKGQKLRAPILLINSYRNLYWHFHSLYEKLRKEANAHPRF